MNAVVALEVPDAVLTERICGRWVHKASGRSYHAKFAPPKSLGGAAPSVETMLDDETGEALMQRADDTEEALKQRLVNFAANRDAVAQTFASVALTVDGNRDPETVWAEVDAYLSK